MMFRGRRRFSQRIYRVTHCPELPGKRFEVKLFEDDTIIIRKPAIHFVPGIDLADKGMLLAISCLRVAIYIRLIRMLVVWKGENDLASRI